MAEWSDFNRFGDIFREYLPAYGEGETLATQVATAVSKLVYKWFNDGDVYDNTHGMTGWCNDLSSYANWLAQEMPHTEGTLERIFDCYSDGEYEEILYQLCELTAVHKHLERWNGMPKQGSVYNCEGQFRFEEYEDEEDDWELEDEEAWD